MQHFLKSASGAAEAEIVAAELLLQFDIAMDDADAALHARFGRVGSATLARDLKRTAGRGSGESCGSWQPPVADQRAALLAAPPQPGKGEGVRRVVR